MNLCCCFGVFVFFYFFFFFFKTPIQILVRKDLHFPHTVAVSRKKRCHLRSESKDGDSAGLHLSTASLQSESVYNSFSSLKIRKYLSLTLKKTVSADTV